MSLIRILAINYLENVVSEKLQEIKVKCSVSNFNSDGNMLLFGMREH